MKLAAREHFPCTIRKAWMIMRLTTLLLITTALHLSAKTSAQKITLSSNGISVEQFFHLLEKQTGYSFLLENGSVALDRKISVHVTNVSLETVLDQILKPLDLSYRVDDKIVYIVKAIIVPEIQNTNGVVPPIDIRGRIMDSLGNPLIGASVIVKGTKLGTQTRNDGSFEITGIPGSLQNVTLEVSFTGYMRREVKPGSDYNTIVLSASTSPLDEVQVIAYGTTTKRFNLGSVSRVTSAQIDEQPILNPLEALQGRASGVFIQTQNGLPGGNIKVQIRGQNSIAAGTDPLYVVDGVPFTSTPLNSFNNNLININGLVSPLNSIPPSEIESIEVLKDADATAIYGSRAANGVILITTKKGASGKTKLSLNYSKGVSTVSKFAKYLNLQDYLKLANEAYRNDEVTPSSDPNSPHFAPDLLVWDTTKSTDWQKYILGGQDQTDQFDFNFSGGNANTHFLVGGNFRKEGSVLPGDQSYMRNGLLFNIEHNYNRLRISFNGNYNTDNNNLIQSPSAVGIAQLPPDYPAYNPDGTLNWIYPSNPVAWLNQHAKMQSYNTLFNSVINYNLLEGLYLRVSLGYNRLSMDMLSTFPASSQWPLLGPNSYATFGSNYSQTYLAEPQIEYSRNFSRKDNFKILVGSTYQKTESKGFSITGENYSNENLLSNLSYAGDFINPLNNISEYKYASVFGRINYIRSEKYLISLNARRDGSSKFGPSNEYGNFGSAGIGWIFSEENFSKRGLKFLSYGKLRATYGITGNDQISPYQYLSTYINGYSPYQGQRTLQPYRIANGSYAWETNRKLEIGLDASFLNDRIGFTIQSYLNRCDNLLVSYPLPGASGPFGSYQANLPAEIENSGLEIEISSTNIKNKFIKWETFFNISFSKNRLVSFPNIQNTAYANTYVVGKDLSIVKGYKFLNVDPATGIAQFEDVNKDGILSYPDDYVAIGKTSPDFFGGLTNSISISNFQLDFTFQFVRQSAIGNTTLSILPYPQSNFYTSVYGRWQKPGDITNIPRLTATYGTPAYSTINQLASSSAAYFNSSYIRLKNVSLRYNLPQELLKRLKLSHFDIYLNGQNLLLFTKDKNVDPETINSNSATVPVLKSFVIGIHASI